MRLTRKLQTREFEYFIQTCKEEGWLNNTTHIKCLYQSYSDDFLVSLDDNVITGFVIALKESDDFGLISNLIIVKKYRSLGFAKELLEFAISHLESRQIALDSIYGKEKLYEKFGFKSYFETSFYKYQNGSFSLPDPHLSVSDVSLKDVLKHNKNTDVLKVSLYTTCMYNSNNSIYQAIYNNNELSSYAFRLKYKDGYQIIISSDDIDESLILFFKLCADLANNVSIYFEVSQAESINLNIVKQLKMAKLSSSTKMYNKILK